MTRLLRLAVGVALAGIATIGGVGTLFFQAPSPMLHASPAGPASGTPTWTAAAPGVVEPREGLIRLGAVEPGRIDRIYVRPGDTVQAGDILVRFVDDAQRARLQAAQAEVAFRTAERDTALDRPADDAVSRAKDAVAAKEVELAAAQAALDAAQGHGSSAQGPDPAGLRQKVEAAKAALERARSTQQIASAEARTGQPNRKEAALDAARSELAVARAGLETTLIRAPSAGTVLEIDKHLGERASASSDDVVAVLGDLQTLAVRAELDEADAGKVGVGDAAEVRCETCAEKVGRGTVVAVARLMSPRKLGALGGERSPRSEVQSVRLELDKSVHFIPGARVDVFFTASPKVKLSGGMP